MLLFFQFFNKLIYLHLSLGAIHIEVISCKNSLNAYGILILLMSLKLLHALQ